MRKVLQLLLKSHTLSGHSAFQTTNPINMILFLILKIHESEVTIVNRYEKLFPIRCHIVTDSKRCWSVVDYLFSWGKWPSSSVCASLLEWTPVTSGLCSSLAWTIDLRQKNKKKKYWWKSNIGMMLCCQHNGVGTVFKDKTPQWKHLFIQRFSPLMYHVVIVSNWKPHVSLQYCVPFLTPGKTAY